MVDGSTDKNNNEIVSTVCRYIVEGTPTDEIKVVEHVVHMGNLPDRSARQLLALGKCSLDGTGEIAESFSVTAALQLCL